MKKLLFIFLTVIFFSCNHNLLYQKKIHLEAPFVWHKDSVYNFFFEHQAQNTKADLWLNLRHELHYPYHNIYLFLTKISPSGVMQIDTLQFYLQNPETGEYYGKGYTKILSTHFLLQEKEFNEQGTYQFLIQHGMRDSLLPGVVDLGFEIERSTP